jgi:thymidylate synthase
MWFIRGSTNNAELVSEGVHIWDANSTRDFLDSRGLTKNAEGDLGPVYGHQWRHFNAAYTDCHTDYTGKGVDQLAYIIDALKTPESRSSRRLVMSAWNPCQIDEIALPPCHVLAQFNVKNGKYLSCSLYQRSGDVGLGVPFNIASYSFLTHLLAKHCGLIAEEFILFLGNAHIYEEHIQVLEQQILRTPFKFPKINIREKRDNIEDYKVTDIEWIEPYKFCETLKMQMKA